MSPTRSRDSSVPIMPYQSGYNLTSRSRDSWVDEISSGDDSNDDELVTRRNRFYESARLFRKTLVSRVKDAVTIKNTINLGFILIVSFICLSQCYTQVMEYLKFSIKIQVSHAFPSSPLWMLPGVTICSNNRVRLSKLMKEYSIFEEKFNHIMNDSNPLSSLASGRKNAEMLRIIKRVIDESLDIADILNESPIDKLIDLADLDGTRMITDINCNSLWGRQFNCENFRIVKSFQASPCYTMFYMGSLIEALANGKAYEFDTSLLGGQTKNASFAENEIAEILVDFEPHYHADFQRDIGGRIVVHSTGHIGSLRDMSYSLMPGHKYDIVVQRTMVKRLPPPYTSDCYDYKLENSKKFESMDTTYPSTPLDKTTCTRNCITRRTTKACDCWPVETPFYPNDSIIANSGSLRYCAWGFEESQKNYSSGLYIDCYRRNHSICRRDCKHGCRTEDYKVSVISNAWPTRDRFFAAIDERERSQLQSLANCCALVSIKYQEFMENRHIMYPSMTSAQLVSNIGGIVSALIGVSAVTIYRYLTRRVFKCRIVRDYSPKPANDGTSGKRGLGK